MSQVEKIGMAHLWLGDCIEIMPALQKVDCVIADPPYGETSLAWDRRVLRWPAAVRDVLQPWGSIWCFGSLRFFMESVLDFEGWALAQDCVWEKHNGSNSANDRFRRVHEHAAQFYPADAQWSDVFKRPIYTNDAAARAVRRGKKRTAHWGDIGESVYVSQDGGPLLMRSVMFARSCHGFAIHETQKPEECYAPLIEYSCKPGGVVLDPFAGSGTLAVVCNANGVRSISIEKCPVRFAAACERVEDALRQSPMFPIFTPEPPQAHEQITLEAVA